MTAEPPRLRPFHPEAVDDLLRFIHAHPVGDLDSNLLRELLTGLPRSPGHVLDVHHGDERLLVATLLDTLVNASNAAVLEILGLRVPRAPETDDILPWLLAHAEQQARQGPRPILEIALPPALHRHAPVLARRGYHVAFTQYHMHRATADHGPAAPLADDLHFRDATLADVPAYHALLARAFTGVPGTHIADLATFTAMFTRNPRRPRLLLHRDHLVGFVKTSLDADGETGVVHTLGRDPGHRGHRLGDVLLHEAMRALASAGARRLRLEVIAHNRSALDLYLRHDFTVAAELPTYQRALFTA